jgi:hypothetical protein
MRGMVIYSALCCKLLGNQGIYRDIEKNGHDDI